MDEEIKNRICVCIGNVSFPDALAIASKYGFIEIRQDLAKFSDEEIEQLIGVAKKSIFTLKSETGNVEERIEQYRHAIMSGAQIIDVDYLEDTALIESVKELALSKGTQLLISCHLIDKNRDLNELAEIAKRIFSAGADIVKLVVPADNEEELDTLAELYTMDYPEGKLIAFGIGALSLESRNLAHECGAPFVYAAPDGFPGTIDSQPTYSEIYEKIDNAE